MNVSEEKIRRLYRCVVGFSWYLWIRQTMSEPRGTGHSTCQAELLAEYSRVVQCEILRGLCMTQEWPCLSGRRFPSLPGGLDTEQGSACKHPMSSAVSALIQDGTILSLFAIRSQSCGLGSQMSAHPKMCLYWSSLRNTELRR